MYTHNIWQTVFSGVTYTSAQCRTTLLEQVKTDMWQQFHYSGSLLLIQISISILQVGSKNTLTKKAKTQITNVTKDESLLAVDNDSLAFVDELVAPHPSVRTRVGHWGLSLPGHSGSAVKGVLVSWERELRPSPDAERLPRDSVLNPDWRKCSVRARQHWAWITVSCLYYCRMGD